MIAFWLKMYNTIVTVGNMEVKNRKENKRKDQRYRRRLRVLCFFQVERAGV